VSADSLERWMKPFDENTYIINPCPKPRMVNSDKWKKRPPVLRYFAFKDECKLKKVEVPEAGSHIIFHIPMPKSWSKKKKLKMLGQPHQQWPDRDKLDKALLDAVLNEDSGVWDARVTKLLSDIRMIEIKPLVGDNHE